MLQQIQESFWRSGEVRQSDVMWCWRKWGKWDAEPSELRGDGPNSVIKNMYESYLIKKSPNGSTFAGWLWNQTDYSSWQPLVQKCTQGCLPWSTVLYSGLTALGPKMYIGLAALGTKMYPMLPTLNYRVVCRAACPEVPCCTQGRQPLVQKCT